MQGCVSKRDAPQFPLTRDPDVISQGSFPPFKSYFAAHGTQRSVAPLTLVFSPLSRQTNDMQPMS